MVDLHRLAPVRDAQLVERVRGQPLLELLPEAALVRAVRDEQGERRGVVLPVPVHVHARGLAEEAPFSYKDVDAVVETVERAGLARRAVRLVPIGVVKG